MALLESKICCITGGTSGIGKAIAKGFLQQKAKVVVVGTNPEKGKKVVEELSNLGEIEFIRCDVSSSDSCKQLSDDISARYSGLDVLINCAGITRDGLLMRMSEEDWDRVQNVNLKSAFLLSKLFLRSLMKRKGKIINISSVIGLTGNAGQANYSASKFGMIGLTKSLAKEVAVKGVCVNAIAPGFIETEMTDILTDEQKSRILTQVPMKRLGKPEEIASSAVFLASSWANYVTGTVLTVDGGMLA